MRVDLIDKDVWVLAGQSNMEGVGVLRQALPPDPRIWSFTSAGAWEVAAEPLHWFWESYTAVHRDLRRAGLPAADRALSDAELAARERAGRTHGTGLGLAFAKAMADGTSRPIGLIPAAHGATSLDQWSPALKAQGGRSLYGAMLDRIALAGGTLRGVLWYQGEAEGWLPAEAATYRERFVQWVKTLRADVGCADLPVLTVQIGNTTLGSIESAWNQVRQAQYVMPTLVPNVTVTGAVDLGLVDSIHLHADALNRLGRRLARQALALAAGRRDDALGPRVVSVERLAGERGLGEVCIRCSGVAGSWSPADRIGGFSVQDAAGQPIPGNAVFNALCDPTDPAAILVWTDRPLREGEVVAYGQGLNPPCNAVDQADMPLCAFVPDVIR
jgi:sialate O-acetylesterase